MVIYRGLGMDDLPYSKQIIVAENQWIFVVLS